MKIINRKQFLKAPEGTIYSEFKPCIINGLYIKNESYGLYIKNKSLGNDWYYQDLINSMDYNDSREYTDKLFKAKTIPNMNYAKIITSVNEMYCLTKNNCF